MGTKNMAAAMGTAVLLYLVLSGRLSVQDAEERKLLKEASQRRQIEKKEKKEKKKKIKDEEKERKDKGKDKAKWPVKPPVSLGQTLGVAARTVRYTWKQTLGKWTLGELAFGIKYYMKQQGNLQHEYTEGKSVQMGHEVREELVSLLRHLVLCMYFSKKSYKMFMEHGKYTEEDVLVKKCKARLLKPSFTVVRDADTKCFLLLIRGAISVNERLTAATGAPVPFHHVMMRDGVVTDVVLGHSHCGMVAAARWIAKCAVPPLTEAVRQYPDYNVKIIGHSMGAAIASILTFILREHKEFSSCTCIAFAPAACMTWDLAESGKDFITTLVNKTDVVPSFSLVSAAQLQAEVAVSSWLNDLRDQIQHTRFLNLVNRSVAFMRSHVPFVSNPHSKVVDADMLLKPDEAKTKDLEDEEETHATEQNKHHRLSCFPCMASRRRGPTSVSSASANPLSTPQTTPQNNTVITEGELISANSVLIADLIAGCSGSKIPDSESESELEPESEIIRELKEQENGKASQLETMLADANLNLSAEGPQLFPPGRIIHMLVLPVPERDPASEAVNEEELVNVYETPREVYGKIRLARSMVRDHYMPRYIKTLQLLIEKFAKHEQEEKEENL